MRRGAAIGIGSLAAAGLALALVGCDGDGGGGDGGGGDGSDTNPHAAAAAKCVDAINAYRQTEGLPAYERWVDQERCANDAAESDSKSGMAHGAFGTCEESAQNECPGWSGPPEEMIGACLEMMWAEGPGEDFAKHGHYINMSNPGYTRVSCGFFETGDGRVWAVQNFD